MIAHGVSPAVPEEAAQRVREFTEREGWKTIYLVAGEFDDSAYLANPIDRCFHCKKNLYSTLALIRTRFSDGLWQDAALMSGANIDDLDEYRPGLEAAKQFGVRHPYVEANICKTKIREICRELDLSIAEIPASPCLASRLYTGTRVTERRVLAIDSAEMTVRREANIDVVRCRIRDNEMLIEVLDEDKGSINDRIVAAAWKAAQSIDTTITKVTLDSEPYRAGRAFRKVG